jgi:hypothetical protein
VSDFWYCPHCGQAVCLPPHIELHQHRIECQCGTVALLFRSYSAKPVNISLEFEADSTEAVVVVK